MRRNAGVRLYTSGVQRASGPAASNRGASHLRTFCILLQLLQYASVVPGYKLIHSDRVAELGCLTPNQSAATRVMLTSAHAANMPAR